MSRLTTACVVLLAGCSPKPVDFVIDATQFAADFPTALLKVELVLDGAMVEHADLVLSETSKVTLAGAINPVFEYGVAAWADMDADDVCEPDNDLGWLIIYTPAPKVDFIWVVDPAEVRSDGYACAWFGGGVIDTGGGADTDGL